MLLLRMPLITLTSDFGIQNHALASVKGRILSGFPDASIIDITHTINGFNLQQTAYVFRQAYRHFPHGSFHFILSELYAHPSRQLLYAFEHGQHIFCADNGLLTMLFNDKPIQIFRLTEPIRPYNLISVTDLFLSAVSTVLDQHNDGMEIVTVDEIQIKHTALASYNNDMLEAQVLYIDHFGNVVVNVTRHQFDEARRGRKFTILFMRYAEINTISEHYNDVPEGDNLCLFNSADFLELAVNHGNAARLFGFKESNDQSLFYNTIKIFFE